MVRNADIAAVFEEIADLLELGGENAFRIRAYRNAARTILSYSRDLAALLAEGKDLPKLPGIGADLDGKIHEIAGSGTSALVERLRRQFPAGLPLLLKLPGLGPKRVKALYDTLHVGSLEALRQAAEAGRIRELPGFGERTEQRILDAVVAGLGQTQRFRLAVATQYADGLTSYLQRVSGAEQVVVAGSFRRRRDTVGDLDVLVTAGAGSAVIEHFCEHEDVREVLAKGSTRASVRLACGLQVDLRRVAPESFGAALHYFTGSKAHNIAVRRLGQARGLKINEYGVFKGPRRVAGDTEQSVYAAVSLPYIPPELREDRGEIEAAAAGRLPRLIERSHLRGDLHVHSKASDGRNSIREMALAAQAAGLEYIAITDHSRGLPVAHGLDASRLARQSDEIDQLDAELSGITVLKGAEVDILDDGRLDFPDSVLAKLDIVIVSVHSRFDLPRAKQTERVLRALDNRYVTMLGHPSGRLIGTREGIDIDMERIIRAAGERHLVLELNSQPDRLDLLDHWCQAAKAEGTLVCINSDAHSTFDFQYLDYGIGQARRGWLEAADVLNTRSLADLAQCLPRAAVSVVAKASQRRPASRSQAAGRR
jgi:DNA polymerase (family X)